MPDAGLAHGVPATNIRRSRDAGLGIDTLRVCRPKLSEALSGIGDIRGFSTRFGEGCGSCRI